MNGKKNIFIIGAGPSGLAAVKEMAEAGLNPLCVDSRDAIGGLFNSCYNELYTTTTNMFMAFSDFPPKENLKFWSKEEYLSYMNDYVNHFNLEKFIKLNTTVEKCVLDDCTGRWKLKTSNSSEGKEEPRFSSFTENVEAGFTYDADYLLVATGTNQIPNVPKFKNLSNDIKVLHSSDFKDATTLCKGKKVLIIGNGESAADVAAQSTDVAEKVTLWSRRDFSIGMRFLNKFLTEAEYDERKILHEQDELNLQPNDMLECISNSRILSRLPLGIFSAALDAMLSDVTSLHGKESPAGVTASIMKKNFRPDFFALDTSAPTKSACVIAHAAATKGLDVVIGPSVQFIADGKTARFEDVTFQGKTEIKKEVFDVDVDVIVLCTGYNFNFDWIEIEGRENIEANPRKWFKHCFPADLGDKLGLLGYARPAQGGIPQCSELLARYVALLIKGDRVLPKNYDVQAVIEGRAEAETFYGTSHTLALVEFSPFANSVARLIGCEPSAPLLSPARFVKFWTLPLWTCFFRLNGPGAKPEVCWKVVDKYRIKDTLLPMPLLIIFVVFAMLMQPLMILEYLFGPSLLDRGQLLSEFLPRSYRWRVGGHFYQLSGNRLTLSDVLFPAGWLLFESIFFAACWIWMGQTKIIEL